MNQEDTLQLLDWTAPNRAMVPVLLPQAQSNPRATVPFDEVLLDDDVREILSEDGWQVACVRIRPRTVILVNNPMYTDGPVELGRFVLESVKGLEYCPEGTVVLNAGRKSRETWMWNLPNHPRNAESAEAVGWLTSTEAQLEYRAEALAVDRPTWKGNNAGKIAASIRVLNGRPKMNPSRKWLRGGEWKLESLLGATKRGYDGTKDEVVEFALLLDKALMGATLQEVLGRRQVDPVGSKASIKGLRRTLTNIRENGTPEDYDEVCLVLEQELAEFKKGWQPERD